MKILYTFALGFSMKPFGIKNPPPQNRGSASKRTLAWSFALAPKIGKSADIPKGFIENFLIKHFDKTEILDPFRKVSVMPLARRCLYTEGVCMGTTSETLPRKIVKPASAYRNRPGRKGCG